MGVPDLLRRMPMHPSHEPHGPTLARSLLECLEFLQPQAPRSDGVNSGLLIFVSLPRLVYNHLLGGSWDVVSMLRMKIAGVTAWLIGVVTPTYKS